MDFELLASTEPGKRMVELAEKHAVDFAASTTDVSSSDVSVAEAFQLIKNAACAKKFVMETSGVIVNRAITLFGGGGFLAGSTLARLYRDVRAGPLMQPWADNQAIEFIGKVSLGLDPNED